MFIIVPLQAPWRRSSATGQQPEAIGDTVVFFLGTRELRAKGPTAQAQRDSAQRPSLAPPPAVAAAAAPPPAAATPTPEPAAPLPVDKPIRDTNAVRSYSTVGETVTSLSPQVGDGRLWVSPRPGLPAAVAATIYGDTAGRNQQAIARLKAMVDSLNQVLDQIQREKQRPSWTIGGTPDKPTWGLDSAFIHIAGIKIPTPALALLGNFLPQGNYDEGLRARQLQYMREDLMQAAARAQSFQQFRSYVRELRERKQAERDADERRRAQDTVHAVP
ncbi:MAG TPA: hypothetical protein VN513_09395 [Gemmatimonadales bacterium]|nr:hypothetical protein [Gemmatimonadales bacterium]